VETPPFPDKKNKMISRFFYVIRTHFYTTVDLECSSGCSKEQYNTVVNPSVKSNNIKHFQLCQSLEYISYASWRRLDFWHSNGCL